MTAKYHYPFLFVYVDFISSPLYNVMEIHRHDNKKSNKHNGKRI